jgi:subtilase family serine protease
MRSQRFGFLRFLVCFAFLPLWAAAVSAQNPAPETRITQAVDNANRTLLKGNVFSMARPEFDRGAAPLNLPMERMTLVLRSTPEQQAALTTLLDEQQDQSSPNYHKWLTPTQFGQQFGASEQDIQTITSWLQSQGFQVNHVANGRNAIEFSGTAGQVKQAFHTAIHKYSVPNAAGVSEDHWANSADPQIPAALAPVVVGVATLHNFLKAPQHVRSSDQFHFEKKPGAAPEFSTSSGIHAVSPGDLAIIYNAAPLYAGTPAINGTGSTVAVVARSNIDPQDLADFRSSFGISGPEPQIVLNGRDPGVLTDGNGLEGILDISYSNALAQQANVNFVISASTNTADGVDLSERHIVDNNLGDVMTESFGGCEEGATAADGAGISNLAEQAAAQGITYMVSSGDSGSAGCDHTAPATHGPSVNILASSPYTIGVGGTMFAEGSTPTTYWNATNSATFVTAKSYIPEDVWNQSCATGAAGCTTPNLDAGSGGVSTLFAQPAWQSGVAGISAVPPMRNLPDVSLTAAGHDPYLVCLQGSCENGEFEGVFGTSASVQAFGGIMALVRQKVGARVGQADYVFYKLAATETLASCNGSQATPVPATACIFYDTTVGNNAVPGITGGDYPATVGYDRASGLGSVNITNLVNQWSSVTFAPSVTTLTVAPATLTHGASATFNIAVAPKTGTPSFTNEDVSVLSSAGTVINDYPISTTGTASESVNTLVGGNYSVTAHYPGNGALGSSSSAAVPLTVSAESTTSTASALAGNPSTATTPFTSGPYGSIVTLECTVAGLSGVGEPTGTVGFSDNGAPAPGGPVTINGQGAALPLNPITAFSVGSHSVAATYSGDPSFKTSVSAPVAFSISQAQSTAQIDPPENQIVAGIFFQLTVEVDTTSFGNPPTGTVTLFSGATQLGAPQALTNGGADQAGVISLANFNTTSFPPGQNALTAKYSGDANYAASTSPALTVNILRASNTSISSSNLNVQQGSNVTFTANVTASAGGPAITGTIQFTIAQGTNIGTPVALTNGQAQLTTSSLGSGVLNIYAQYSGDSNYASSNMFLLENVAPGADFSVSAAPSPITVTNPGLSAMTTVTVAGSNGFSGVTTFSCAGLPAKGACAFLPVTVTGSGTTMLTVTTTAASGVGLGGLNTFNDWTATSGAIRALIFSAALFILAVQIRRRRWSFAGALLVVALLLGTAACGGGGGTPPPVIPGTPAGTTTVTVTATSAAAGSNPALTHSTTFTLTVN